MSYRKDHRKFQDGYDSHCYDGVDPDNDDDGDEPATTTEVSD